jgi:DNA repair ATPase RecN
VVETLKSAAIGVDDASDAIRDYLDKLEADPEAAGRNRVASGADGASQA